MKEFSTRRIMLLSLALVVIEVAILCALAVDTTWQGSWIKLVQWDGGWYQSIMNHGYQTHFPPQLESIDTDNVAYFPGFPALALILKYIFNLSSSAAMIWLAHLSLFLFWTYFFLLCRRWKISARSSLIAALVFFSYFGSYFLAVAYAEGLFFAAFLGMIFFTQRFQEGAAWAWPVAALHGIVLSSARLVGLPLCAFPLLYALLLRLEWRKLIPFAALSAASCFGAIAFFAYCQWRFDHWDMYFIAQRTGWGNKVDLLLPLNPIQYFSFSTKELAALERFDGAAWGHVSAAFTFLFAVFCVVRELFRNEIRGREIRWPLLLLGSSTFYIALSRAGLKDYSGMYRYSLPAILCFVLATFEINVYWPLRGRTCFLLTSLLVTFALFIQFDFAMQYMAGIWME